MFQESIPINLIFTVSYTTSSETPEHEVGNTWRILKSLSKDTQESGPAYSIVLLQYTLPRNLQLRDLQ
jgi:hypothetical protein